MPRSDRSDADRVPNSQDDEDEDDDVLPVPYDFLNTRHGPVPDTETAVHIIHSARDHLFEIQLAAKKSTKKKAIQARSHTKPLRVPLVARVARSS
jgi:hypothetical protein